MTVSSTVKRHLGGYVRGQLLFEVGRQRQLYPRRSDQLGLCGCMSLAGMRTSRSLHLILRGNKRSEKRTLNDHRKSIPGCISIQISSNQSL